MKLLYCPSCNDVVLMRPEPRTCFCGKSTGHYREDGSTVEQTNGTLSIALHNHDFRAAIDAFLENRTAWSPFMVMRAYLNPHCETDVVYVDGGLGPSPTPADEAAPTDASEPTPAAVPEA